MNKANATKRKQFRKLFVSLGLKMLTLGKHFFPEVFIRFVFSRLVKIELKFESKRSTKISVCKYKYGAKGSLCISIDFDLQIGIEKLELLKKGVAEIIHIAEKYRTPISWGICGNLARDQPKTFEQIVGSATPHDLGSHTFNHVDFSSPKCTESIAKDEILKGIDLLKKIGRPVTFIFPWNRAGYLSLVKENGFITYRGNNIAMLSYPTKVNGLWNIHKTYYLTEKTAREVNLVLRLIDSAISYSCVLHIWNHPWNIAICGNTKKFTEKVLEPIFNYAKQKRDENLLWICTMRELANYCEARDNCQVSRIEKTRDKISFSAQCKINDTRFDFPPTITFQIQIPWKWRNTRALIDKREQKQGPSCFIARRNLRRYLFLTVSFEKSSHQICLLKAF